MLPFLRCSLHFPCPRFTINSFASKRSLSSSTVTAYGEAQSPNKSRTSCKELTNTENNILFETKIQRYLDHIAENRDISIEELERYYKPPRRPNQTARNYEAAHTNVVAHLLRSFSLAQLRNIVKLYEIDIPAKLTKRSIAVTIVERGWRWPSLAGMKQEKLDSETICESFLLNAKQAFLILGKDGANLLDLSSKFGVHVSFSSSPLSLKVEGPRASLGQLSTYISDFKTGIKERYFELPAGLRVQSDSLQHISRQSGVFAENAGEGLICMTYKDGDEAAVRFAERLILRAASEVELSSAALVYLAHNRSKPAPGQVSISQPTYSLYPFHPSQLKSSASKHMCLFRVGRLEDSLQADLNNVAQDTGGPSEIAHVMDLSGNSVDLRDAFLTQVPSSPVNHRVTASFGHLLVSSISSKSRITPPLSGSQKLPKLFEWFKTDEPKRVFISSLPHPLINCTPAQQHMIHRIVYRSPSKTHGREEFLKFELVLDTVGPSSKKIKANGDDDPMNTKDPLPRGIDPCEDVVLAPTCWTESSRHFDLMLPDRPMDIRFSVSTDHIILRQHWPRGLETYYNNLKSFLTTSDQAIAQPDIPLTLTKDGIDYQLSLSSTVRQTLDPDLSVSLLSEPSLRLVVESVLELESHERSRLCQVTCDDITSDVSWEAFLKNCNILVASPSSTQTPPSWNFS